MTRDELARWHFIHAHDATGAAVGFPSLDATHEWAAAEWDEGRTTREGREFGYRRADYVMNEILEESTR